SGNTLSMSVRERVHEVGILKALGFTPSAILGMILAEAAVIALTAAAIGCLLAGLLCSVIRNVAPPFIPGIRSLGVTPTIAGPGLAIALVTGVVSAFVAAMSASRRPIVSSLPRNG